MTDPAATAIAANKAAVRNIFTAGAITFAELETAFDLIEVSDAIGLSRLLIAAAERTIPA